MKCLRLLTPTASLLALTACSVLNQPLNSTSGSSPLDLAGSSWLMEQRKAKEESGAIGSFTPGDFLVTTAPQTPFFLKSPAAHTDKSDQMLPYDTAVKFISDEEEYFKVELNDGKVGFVPAFMVSLPMDPGQNLPGIVDLPELKPGENFDELPPLPPTDENGVVIDIGPLPDGADKPAQSNAPAAPSPTGSSPKQAKELPPSNQVDPLAPDPVLPQGQKVPTPDPQQKLPASPPAKAPAALPKPA